MARKARTSARATAPVAAARGSVVRPMESHGRAYTLGWRCFLALVVLTPLVLGVLPPQLGALAAFRAFDVVGLPKAVAILVLAGLSFAAVCVGVIRGEAEVRWHPVLWVVVGLIGWAGVSTALSASPAVSVWGSPHGNEGLVAIFGYGLVAFLAVQYVRSTRALRAVAIAAAVAGSLVAAYALLQSFGIDPLGWINDTGRVFSTMGNADALGTYLVFPLALAAGLALSSPAGRARAGWWAATALVAGGLVASATRGAWIGALAAALSIGIVGWGGGWRLTRARKFALTGAAFAGLAAAAAAIVSIRPRLAANSTTLRSLLTSLSNGRTIIWLTGLRAWLVHPVTGWGPDGFGRAFQRAVDADWFAIVEGIQAAENAHGLPVQVLVTLGIPGLALTAWALGATAVASLRSLRSGTGPARLLLVSVWGALVGTIVALAFGVTTPAVTVWLWVTVGLLLAPIAQPVRTPPKALLALGAVLGIVLALWAGTWVYADVLVGHAMGLAPGPVQVAELETAAGLDPLAVNYRWLAAEAIVNEAVADQQAGAGAAAVDATILRAISAYETAVSAAPGDALVRTAFANVLVGYAARHPGSGTAQQAVDVALQAVELAPRNPAALAALARAYDVSGRRADAELAALRARQVAPAYAAQTLGNLGLGSPIAP